MTLDTAYAIFRTLIDKGYHVSVSGGPPSGHPLRPKGEPDPPWCGLTVRGENLEYDKEDLMVVNQVCKEHGVDWKLKINEGITIR